MYGSSSKLTFYVSDVCSGYLAPQYAMRGCFTKKVDVFSFGVVVLEIFSGRPNSDTRLDEEKTYFLGCVMLILPPYQ